MPRIRGAKDFKGKGLALAQRQAQADLDTVIAQMTDLARATDETLSSTPYRLRYAMKRATGGNHHDLRWRVTGRSATWIAWSSLVIEAARYPEVLRQKMLQFELDRIALMQFARLLRFQDGLFADTAVAIDAAQALADQYPHAVFHR
uniref:hypothetical protein n=1 Tax=Burkholderia arboris TaxID=488730 RepID=UPI003BEF102F